jgi:hypothetical protein
MIIVLEELKKIVSEMDWLDWRFYRNGKVYKNLKDLVPDLNKNDKFLKISKSALPDNEVTVEEIKTEVTETLTFQIDKLG